MTHTLPTAAATHELVHERVLGSYERGVPGPIVVVCGGIHGNEPAGLAAARAVLAGLQSQGLPLRGKLLGIAGNLAALPLGRRFVQRDLNRRWYSAEIERILASDPGLDGPEDRQQRELMELVGELEGQTRRPLVFLDLHSTSGDSTPFVCGSDTLRNRRIVLHLPLPVLFGLDEAIDGTAAGFLTERGHTAIAIEGGRNDRPATVEHLESAVWLALVAAGSLAAADCPGLAEHRARLGRANVLVPPLLEIRYRHPVVQGDGFRMRPGFESFQPVYRGQLLAHDATGEIHAPESCLLLMPLYQEQGEDGYFLAGTVSRWWLLLSTMLRRLRSEALLGLLPGLQRAPAGEDRWVLDPERAPAWAPRVLALYGYRRRMPQGSTIVFARRRPGHLGRVR